MTGWSRPAEPNRTAARRENTIGSPQAAARLSWRRSASGGRSRMPSTSCSEKPDEPRRLLAHPPRWARRAPGPRDRRHPRRLRCLFRRSPCVRAKRGGGGHSAWRSQATGAGIARRNRAAPLGKSPQPRQFRDCIAGAWRVGGGRHSVAAAAAVRRDADRARRWPRDLRPRDRRHRIVAEPAQDRTVRLDARQGAQLLLALNGAVKMLGNYARLHYRLLKPEQHAA